MASKSVLIGQRCQQHRERLTAGILCCTRCSGQKGRDKNQTSDGIAHLFFQNYANGKFALVLCEMLYSSSFGKKLRIFFLNCAIFFAIPLYACCLRLKLVSTRTRKLNENENDSKKTYDVVRWWLSGVFTQELFTLLLSMLGTISWRKKSGKFCFLWWCRRTEGRKSVASLSTRTLRVTHSPGNLKKSFVCRYIYFQTAVFVFESHVFWNAQKSVDWATQSLELPYT